MTRIAFVALFALIALLVAIAKLPASLFVAFVPANAQRWVNVHQVEGTLWRGRAKFSLPIALPAAQQIEWQCAPSLMKAAIACDLSGALSGRAIVRPLAQTLAIENIATAQSVSASPNSALTISSAPITVSLARGVVSALAIDIEGSALAKQVLWRSGAQTLDFGEVSLECKSTGAPTTECIVRNRLAPATLDGKLSLTPQRLGGYVEYGMAGASKQRVSF